MKNLTPELIAKAKAAKSAEELFRSEYTFENFVVGSSNKFANSAAVADYKSGKEKALQAIFGACMRELKGAGDPAVIKSTLEQKLK